MLLRSILAVLVLLLILGGGAWIFGPREPARLETGFDPAVIGDDPAAYLARTEADIPNLRPNAEKEIVWAYPASKAKTPLALVYIHGFSAAKGEVRPLADEVAAELGANLFYTRLAGHGRDGAAMEQAAIGDWVDDFAEAMAIGRQLGERVVVIGTSTGATLATLGASRPELSEDLAGLVAISPNYQIRDWRAHLLTLPFARRLMPYLADETYGFEPATPNASQNWTTRYPTVALLPMARLVERVRGLDFAAMQVPALFIDAPGDTIVDPARTAAIASAWGAPHRTISISDSTDAAQHVLAGDLLSPNTTSQLAGEIAGWIKQLPQD